MDRGGGGCQAQPAAAMPHIELSRHTSFLVSLSEGGVSARARRDFGRMLPTSKLQAKLVLKAEQLKASDLNLWLISGLESTSNRRCGIE